MKRTLELNVEEGDEEEIIIVSSCLGFYLHKIEEFDKEIIFLILSSLDKKYKITNKLYCVYFDENSLFLLSPFLINKIKIKVIYKTNWNNNNFNCYKLIGLINGEEEKKENRIENNDSLLKTFQIIKILKNTFYFYSNNEKIDNIEDEYQKELLKNIFENDFPLISYKNKDDNDLIKTITILFYITSLSLENNNKKTKLNNDNEINSIKDIKFTTLFESLFNKKLLLKQFIELKFNNNNQKIKQFENKLNLINDIKKWKSPLSIILNYNVLKINIIKNIRLLLNDNGIDILELYKFYDNQIDKIYNLILKLIERYNIEEEDKEPKGFLEFEKNKEILILKDSKLLSKIIENLRELFFNTFNKDINNYLIEDLLIFFNNYIIDYSVLKSKKNYSSIYILKLYDLKYIISKFFDIDLNQNNFKLIILINSFNDIKELTLYDFFIKFQIKFNHFKYNKNFINIIEDLDNNKYTDLICYFDNTEENYIIENNINKLIQNIYLNSFLIKDLDLFSKSQLKSKEKTLYYYLLISIKDLRNNNDLNSFNNIINNNINNFTIIYPNSNYSKSRSLLYSKSIKKSLQLNNNKSFEEDKDFFLKEFGEEIYDPDNEDFLNQCEEEINYKNNEESEYCKLSSNFNQISQTRLNILIIIDCHLFSNKEWYNLMGFISFKSKNINNVYLIGCPFIYHKKKFGQPFIDSLFIIDDKIIKSILYNKNNIQENKNEDFNDENSKNRNNFKCSLIKSILKNDVF